jgi:hypothetical protein
MLGRLEGAVNIQCQSSQVDFLVNDFPHFRSASDSSGRPTDTSTLITPLDTVDALFVEKSDATRIENIYAYARRASSPTHFARADRTEIVTSGT